MNCIETIETTWQEFVEKNTIDESQFIYRGHSNSYSKCKFEVWKLISSYNRIYREIPFRKFISQQLEDELFKIYYGNYKYVVDNKLVDTDLITKLYFLQHYGVPTCLLDFTYNPLVALYFATANITPKEKEIDVFTHFRNEYKEDYYISIYKIDYTQLLSKFNIRLLEHPDSYSLSLNYDNYAIGMYNNNLKAHFALDLKPKIRINNKHENYNLTNQWPCFLLFDNKETNNYYYDLETCLIKIAEERDIKFEIPVIQIFNIKYNSILAKKNQVDPEKSNSLFYYLKKNNIYGGNLFNDSQGLKYDFKFFYESL